VADCGINGVESLVCKLAVHFPQERCDEIENHEVIFSKYISHSTQEKFEIQSKMSREILRIVLFFTVLRFITI
jgi:hypothetical protein